MTALHADVLVAGIAIDQALVNVMAEEARQRVADMREGTVLAQIFATASTVPGTGCRLLEDVIVYMMSPKCAGRARLPLPPRPGGEKGGWHESFARQAIGWHAADLRQVVRKRR